jgi:beta-lactamase class A
MAWIPFPDRRPPARPGCRCLVALGLALLATTGAARPPAEAALPAAASAPAWTLQFAADVAAIPLGRGVDLGVHVQDLASGAVVAHRADERWYLASLVKLPVAIAVLRGIEAGRFTLDTPLRLRADDRVDGAGHTNAQPLAAPLTLRFLLEEMMSFSDNTASDMLIALVGLDEVNAVVESLVPGRFGPITTLADVRRQVYGQLTPHASRLRGDDLLRLHARRTDGARLQLLSELLSVPTAQFRLRTLEAAYSAYYASGLNTAPLAAYGQLLAALAQGRALGPEHTAWLLALMERTHTGSQRIKAGLPAQALFAHKTGTQRKRTCDAGIVRSSLTPHAAGLVVVACVRGERSLARAEAALREVARALCRSGLPAGSHHDASTCPSPPAMRDADPAAAGGRAVGGARD